MRETCRCTLHPLIASRRRSTKLLHVVWYLWPGGTLQCFTQAVAGQSRHSTQLAAAAWADYLGRFATRYLGSPGSVGSNVSIYFELFLLLQSIIRRKFQSASERDRQRLQRCGTQKQRIRGKQPRGPKQAKRGCANQWSAKRGSGVSTMAPSS